MRAPITQPPWRCCAVALWIALAGFAVAPAVRADDAGILNGAQLETTDGKQIFESICQGCHMSAAQGAVGAGHYPALAQDPTLASRQYMAITLLMGRRNMPAFGARHAIGFGGPPATLTEEQIAAVINYVRSHFGNHYTDLITAAEVRSLDQAAP
jgi:mono/diheme cytochrome c family protein